MMIFTLHERSPSISDNIGFSNNLRDIDEIIAELKDEYNKFSSDAMSEHRLYLTGAKDALQEIIWFLEKC